MQLKIVTIDVEGKAFAVDTEDKRDYHMPNYREAFRPAVEVDYYPMNLQGFLLPSETYDGLYFDSLELARAFVARTSIQENVRNIEIALQNYDLSDKLKEAHGKVLRLYREEAKRYGISKK